MKTVSNDQKGFATLEIILVVAIVVALVGIGFYVYNSNKNANKNLNSATNASDSATTLSNTSTDTADAAGIRAKEAAIGLLGLVKTKDTDFKSYVDKHVNDGTFSASFKQSVDAGTSLTSASDVYCSTISSTGAVPLTFVVSSSDIHEGVGADAIVQLRGMSGQLMSKSGPTLAMNYTNHVWSVDLYSCN